MTLARFAVSALFLCSLPCFSQDYIAPKSSTSQSSASPLAAGDSSEFKLSALWRIAPNHAVKILGEEGTLEPGNAPKENSEIDLRSSADTRECLTIRSYQMARENKNSDATYLKAYSTCQPAKRYRLKTTEARPKSGDY